jgi:hypothetical protein
VRLAVGGPVARVAGLTAALREIRGHYRRDVRLARWLTDACAPVVGPWQPAGPFERDGQIVTFWAEAQTGDPPAGEVAGRALRRCHDALRAYDGELPSLSLLFDEARSILSLGNARLLGLEQSDPRRQSRTRRGGASGLWPGTGARASGHFRSRPRRPGPRLVAADSRPCQRPSRTHRQATALAPRPIPGKLTFAVPGPPTAWATPEKPGNPDVDCDSIGRSRVVLHSALTRSEGATSAVTALGGSRQSRSLSYLASA